MAKHPAVFLDNDGTLIDDVRYTKQPLGVAPLTSSESGKCSLVCSKNSGLIKS